MARNVEVRKIPSPHTRCVEMVAIDREMPFCCRYDLRDDVLAGSVRRFGILTPIVVQRYGAKYRILAGHKRLEVARSLRLKEVPVFEVEGRLSAKDAFLLGLASNWRQEIPEMDRASALAKAVRELKIRSEEVRGTVLPLLGLPSDPATSDLYLKASDLPDRLKKILDERKIPLRMCTALLRLSKAEQGTFARQVGAKVRLTVSQFAQTAEWLSDISKRDGKSLAAILKDAAMKKVLGHRGMDPRTRADHFFDALKRLRFPGYAARLERFSKVCGPLLRDIQGLRIDHPAGLEERGFELHARVKTPRDMDRILTKLSENRSALNSLFDLML